MTSSAIDQNTILVQLCTKVLKRISPNGMTTKELAAELDKEIDDDFEGISSSILSSKLNAVFRRVHNDTPNPSREQLDELPITRSQSADVPRRLVYRYTPPNSVSKTAGSVTPKRRLSDVSDDGSISPSDSTSGSDADQQNEPLTPKDEVSSWTAKRRKSNNGTGIGVESRPSGVINRKTPFDNQAPRLNLYYDVVGYDAMTAVLAENSKQISVSPNLEQNEKSENEVWAEEELTSPENLELNELDQMVC